MPVLRLVGDPCAGVEDPASAASSEIMLDALVDAAENAGWTIETWDRMPSDLGTVRRANAGGRSKLEIAASDVAKDLFKFLQNVASKSSDSSLYLTEAMFADRQWNVSLWFRSSLDGPAFDELALE